MDETIRAEDTFFERAKIDKANADKKRPSPDIRGMYGARVTCDTMVGGVKITCFYWHTKKRRSECLPRVLCRYANPSVELIN